MLGVIFDMDGVLIDTYGPHLESWRLMGREAGLLITDEQFRATFGRTSRETIVSIWGPERFTDDEIRHLDQRKEALFREILARGVPWMPGAEDLLSSLEAAGFRLGIGTSAPPANVEVTLAALGRREQFAAVVNGSDVSRGKPDPQVFEMAAARMHIPPEWCVVVEDSPLGIEAARAAGTASIGLASTGRTRESLAAADLVVDRLAELSPQRIAELIHSRLHTSPKR